MKTMVSSRQQPEYLRQADEIKVEWNDRNYIFDLVEKYPDKTIILNRGYHHLIHEDNDIEWKEIERYKKLCKDNFILSTCDPIEIKEAVHNNIFTYYSNSVNNFRDLLVLNQLGVCRFVISGPLFFSINKVRKMTNDKFLILSPYAATINHDINLPGQWVQDEWIRPEDVDMYGENTILDFSKGTSLSEERAFFRIYTTEKKWNGELRNLILGANQDNLAVNRLLDSDFTAVRLNCEQKCFSGSGCNLCAKAIGLANPQRYEQLIKQLKTIH